MEPIDHLRRAIAISGSQTALAKAAGVSQNAIWRALQRGRITPELAKKIEEATDGAVSRVDLCPDIFEPLAAA